jgi:hypothetical protein
LFLQTYPRLSAQHSLGSPAAVPQQFPEDAMSLLKLVLSSRNAQRSCQQALPALCAALTSSSSSTAAAALQGVQQQGIAARRGVLGMLGAGSSSSSSSSSFHTAHALFSANEVSCLLGLQVLKPAAEAAEHGRIGEGGAPWKVITRGLL